MPYYNQCEVHKSPLLNRQAYVRIWSLEKTLSCCSRYATFLTLSNKACINLAKNPEVLVRLADHVKFLSLRFVQAESIASLHWLLETLASKNLIGLELHECRVISLQSWSSILEGKTQEHGGKPLSTRLHQIQGIPRGGRCGDDIQDHSRDLPCFDFEVDIHWPVHDETPQHPQSVSSRHSREEEDGDLFSEVFRHHSSCSGITHVSSSESSSENTTDSGRLSPKERSTMDTSIMPQGSSDLSASSTLLSHLRHLKYTCSHSYFLGSAEKPSDVVLLKLLKHCPRLESLVILGLPQSSSQTGALGNAVFDLCSRGKLRYFQLHDIQLFSTSIMDVLNQLLGSYCSFCHPDLPASLRDLGLSGAESGLELPAVQHLAQNLQDVCSCVRKEEIGSTADSQEVRNEKVHNDKGRDKLLVGSGGRIEAKATIPGEAIADNAGESSHANVHVASTSTIESAPAFVGLEKLELRSWSLGNSGAIAISVSLERNSSLRSLSLPCCDIRTPGMSAIFKAITGI